MQRNDIGPVFQRQLLRTRVQLDNSEQAVAEAKELLQQAERWYQKARQELEPLAHQNPAVIAYQSELAAIYMNLGRLAFESSDLHGSAQWLRQAQALLQDISQKAAEHASVKENLPLTTRALEQIEQQLERRPAGNSKSTTQD